MFLIVSQHCAQQLVRRFPVKTSCRVRLAIAQMWEASGEVDKAEKVGACFGVRRCNSNSGACVFYASIHLTHIFAWFANLHIRVIPDYRSTISC